MTRLSVEWMKFVAYRTPAWAAAAAAAVCVAWWCWYAGSQPVGMDERRLAGGGLAMVTQVGLILMAAAAALLVVGDRRPGFFGALTVSPGLHRLLASKLGVSLVAATLAGTAVCILGGAGHLIVRSATPGTLLPLLVTMWPRVVVAFAVAVLLGHGLTLLLGYHLAATVFTIAIWLTLLERVSGLLGPWAAPIRTLGYFERALLWGALPLSLGSGLCSCTDGGHRRPHPRRPSSRPHQGEPLMIVAQLSRATRAELIKGGFNPLIRVLLPVTALTGAVVVGMVMLDRRALDYEKTQFITPAVTLLGFLLFGVLVLLMAAAWRYVGEAATGVLPDTYRVTPRRAVVVLSKALVSALWGGLTALSSVAVAIGVLVVTGPSHVTPALLRPEFIVGLPLVTAAWSMIALSFAVVVRRVIPALAGLVLWYALVEDYLTQFRE